MAVESGDAAKYLAGDIVTAAGVHGSSEVLRLMLSQTGAALRETRVAGAQWPNYARTLRVRELPVLFDDMTCEEVGPLGAVARRIARLTNLYGDCEADRSKADVVFDAAQRWRAAFEPIAYAPGFLRDSAAIEAYFAKQWPAQAQTARRMSLDTECGLMVCERLTFADLAMFEYIDLLLQVRADAVDKVPELKRFVALMRAQPKVAARLAARGKGDLEGKAPTALPVCVVGADSFLGAHLVRLLMDRGYRVHAVPEAGDAASLAHLTSLPRAEAQLRCFAAPSTDDAALERAMDGCGGVFHCASSSLAAAAVRCAAATSSVSRVVYNSTAAGFLPPLRGGCAQQVYATEQRPANVDDLALADATAVAAENAAWEAVAALPAERRLSMVSVCSADLLGPVPNAEAAAGGLMRRVADVLSGRMEPVSNAASATFVDVRDAALAHVKALEHPSAAQQRFLLVGHSLPWRVFVRLVADAAPESSAADAAADAAAAVTDMDATPWCFSQAKARKLGVDFAAAERSVADAVASLRRHNEPADTARAPAAAAAAPPAAP